MGVFDFLFPKRRRPRRSGRIGVLVELASFDKGGLEKVVLDSAIAFDRDRFEVTIVTAGKVGHLGEVARAAGLSVVALDERALRSSYERLLDQVPVDVAMSHFSYAGYESFARRGIPDITFIHNVYAFMSPSQVEEFRRNDRHVTRYVSVSRNATRYAVARLGVDAGKVVTIPNGLIVAEHEGREQHHAPLRREQFGIAEGDYVFANVASYNLHKGHYLMGRALEILLQRRQDIRVLCVGNEVFPPHCAQLRAWIEGHGLARHMLMPGYVADVASVHSISDAFLLPSFIEGWSIAMNEAMFYRKPMILTDTGAAAEVISDEDIGIVLPNEYGDTVDLDLQTLDRLAYHPHDYRIAPLLAAAMERFADDRDGWRRRGAAGREKICRDYDFRRTVSRYQDLVCELAGEAR